jgi:hypothetical protein
VAGTDDLRFWTVDEARAYLPRLRELVERVRDAAEQADHVRTNGHGAPDQADVDAAVDELAAGDIVLRDTDSGLIDFHARGADGVIYFLCWKLDEDALDWWHLPDEGFAGRKRLPRDPE